MKAHVYVMHAVTRQVVARFGQGERAVERALEYAIRRSAVQLYLALRQGLAPTAHEPLRIVARTGRPLSVGESIDRPSDGRFVIAGQFKRRKQGGPAEEIACLFPAARGQAADDLARRYPRTWAKYQAHLP